MLWSRLAHLAVPFLPMAIYFYVTVGLRQYQRDKLLVWSSAVVSIAFVVLTLSTHLVVARVEKHWWGYYPLYGTAGDFLVGYFALAIVLGLAKLRARLKETVKNTVFGRRIAMSAIAGVVLALTSVDFIALFGVDVYPFGYAPVLVFLATIFVLERRHSIVYMTPAAAAPQILRTMQSAVLVTSPEGQIEVSNRAAAQMLQCEESDLVGSPLGRVFTSEEECRAIVAACLAGGTVENVETTWRAADDATIDVTVSASLLTDEEQRPL
jgi:PAS domain-containing protein